MTAKDLNKIDQVRYQDMDLNVLSYRNFGEVVIFNVKKNVNCRVCIEIDLKVNVINDQIDWSTLHKI